MTKTYFGSKDFLIEVAKGNVYGHSVQIKFGENPEVDTGTAEDVWDYGGLYTFSTTAAIDSISSSDNGDTQSTVVIGLDANWEEVSQTITLTGQTRKALTTPLIRVYRMYNNDTTDYAGTIYCYENTALGGGVPADGTKVRAIVVNGNNQTLMSIYTIPAGKTGYLIQAIPTISKASPTAIAANMSLRIREFGKVFRIRGKLGLTTTGTGAFVKPYRMPIRIAEKSDIVIRCDSVSANDTAIAASFDILLVDNE